MAKKNKLKTKFKISPLFVILAAFMIFFGQSFSLVYYFAAVVIHELCHAEVAKRRGYRLNEIKLMPYGASLNGNAYALRVRDEIIIALAGPLVNLILAVVGVAFWWIWPITYVYTEVFVMANIFTALFNLLPLFPLDGGRILLAALSIKFKRQKAYKVLRIIGFITSGIFAVLFFLTFFFNYNLSFAIIAVFFFISVIFPDKNSKYSRLYSMAYRTEKLKKGLTVKEVMISGNASLYSLLKMLNTNYFYRFNIVDDNFKLITQIDELRLEDLLIKYDGNQKVADFLNLQLTIYD